MSFPHYHLWTGRQIEQNFLGDRDKRPPSIRDSIMLVEHAVYPALAGSKERESV